MNRLDLAQRCETSTGPDRDIDKAIAWGGARIHDEDLAPRYTRSLDAAITLVPKGCVPFLDWHHKVTDPAGVVSCEAYVQRIENAQTLGAGEARTYALALCAAALRAAEASGIDAATAVGTTEIGPTEGESPVPKADAQRPPQ